MATTNVISINPSKKTVGAICEEGLMAGGMSRRLLATAAQAPTVNLSSSIILGLKSREKLGTSFKLLMVRILSVVCLMAFCWMTYGVEGMSAPVVVMIAAASMVTLGLTTRIVSTGVAGWMGYLFVQSAMGGVPDLALLMTSIVMMVMAIMGPGAISLDKLMMLAGNRLRQRRHERDVEDADSYRAYYSRLDR